MALTTRLLQIIGGLLMLLIGFSVSAAKIETLIMPGEVISGHAKIESECSQCHARLSKTGQNELCLDCHKEVRKDLQSKQGFHGRKAGLSDLECKTCHTDHKGRNTDIVKLNRDSFDHQGTDFALKGAHSGLSCDSCHAKDKAFREARTDCIGCHLKDDPHKKRLGEKCADCHSERNWTDTKFDHAKTDFALKGAHKEVICSACHPNQRYENTPEDCYSCHALNDIHRGRYGQKCADCHTEQRWDKPSFDHAKETKFPLRGRHAKIECEICHTGSLHKDKLKTDCLSCHRADDTHHGRNGKQCESCHNAEAWSKARFDHTRKTDFPLRGKHADVACDSCHRGNLKDKLSSDCNDCHRADDVHRGKQGKDCARCHQESGWGEKVVFDHDLTHFPLIGLHATVPCEECHVSTTFQQAAKDCVQCHKSEDIHKQSLGTNCAQCHNPNGWALWDFDHDKLTDFKLEGAHQGLACVGCHQKAMHGDKVSQSKTCNTCHAQDDKHRGRYGNQCDRCHDQESFEHVDMRP